MCGCITIRIRSIRNAVSQQKLMFVRANISMNQLLVSHCNNASLIQGAYVMNAIPLIGDNGAAAIAKAIETNLVLQVLNMRDDQIGYDGWM